MKTDEMLDACPGCDREIDTLALECPYCKYDLVKGKPTTEKRRVKKEKPETPERPKKPKKIIRRTQAKLLIPALGRYGKPDIDFPELHWKKSVPVNEKTLMEWVKRLREVWNDRVEECPGHLTNYAILYLVDEIGELSAKNRQKLKKLLGDDGT